MMPDVTIKTLDNGPFIIEGNASVVDMNDRPFEVGKTIALCRCGASGKRPFCDGTHGKVNFTAAERAADSH